MEPKNPGTFWSAGSADVELLKSVQIYSKIDPWVGPGLNRGVIREIEQIFKTYGFTNYT